MLTLIAHGGGFISFSRTSVCFCVYYQRLPETAAAFFYPIMNQLEVLYD